MAIVVSAVATAIEIGTVAAALSAVATVGTAMTVVGVITQSKELTKIGGTLAIVGGLGGLANSALSGLSGAAAAGGAATEAASGLGAAAADTAESGWAGLANDAVSSVNSAAPAMDFAGNNAGIIGTAATPAGLSAGNSLESVLGTPASSSASGATGIVPDASGKVAVDTSSPYLNDYGLPAGGATDKALGVQGPLGVQDIASPADSGIADQLKAKLGPAWDSLGPQGKAEVLKSVLAMPGGIQNQKNIEAQLAIQQQKTNQTSFGSAVPTFGIINKPKVA